MIFPEKSVKIAKIALSLAVASGSLALAGTARGATFTEMNFPSSNLTLSNTYTSGDGDISVAQCARCGVSGSKALRFVIEGGPSQSVGALGVILKNFSYDPSNGALGSVDFAVDKNLIYTGPNVANGFRPLIEQNGTYYWATVPLGNFAGNGASGFIHGSATLSANSFTSYNFDTGVAGTDHPNFSSGLLQFGIAEYGRGYSDFTTIYDNFSVTTNVAAVPEPATWAMMLAGFGMIGFGLRYRRKSVKASLA